MLSLYSNNTPKANRTRIILEFTGEDLTGVFPIAHSDEQAELLCQQLLRAIALGDIGAALERAAA